MINCPYCSQIIKHKDKNCVHCGSILLKKEDDEITRKKVLYMILIVIFFIGLISALMFYQFNSSKDEFSHENPNPPVDFHSVPDVESLSLEEAKKKIGVDWEVQVIKEKNDQFDKDVVIRQDPKDGTVSEKSIKLYVSAGKKNLIMNDYEEKTLEEARDELLKSGVKAEYIEVEYIDSNDPIGIIVSQNPEANETFDPEDTRITFTVSREKTEFVMPRLLGLTEKQAIEEIQRIGLKLADSGIIKAPSYQYVNGTVFDQKPFEPEEIVTSDSEIKIYVSTGYPSDSRVEVIDIKVEPSEENVATEIKIVYSDARGDNIEWGTRWINELTYYPVKLVVSPTKSGLIEIYRDGQLIDYKNLDY